MECDVRAALFWNYKRRLQEYQEAVHRLQRDAEPLLQSEYLLLWELVNRALKACMEAQRRLEHHMVEHRCYFAGHPPPEETP